MALFLFPKAEFINAVFFGNSENHSDPACRAAIDLAGTQAIYDWTALLQPNANSQHQDVVPDGELCGGGNDAFRGMNLARSDWRTSEISPDSNGQFEFVYYATAPHATKDMIMYVTRDNWNPTAPIAWSDMEEICRFGDVSLEQDDENRDVYRMTCDLPEKSGRHVIYNVWQRSDSPEAFYSCSDVMFVNNDPTDPPDEFSNEELCIPIATERGAVHLICF